jgi:hypothetical protein
MALREANCLERWRCGARANGRSLEMWCGPGGESPVIGMLADVKAPEHFAAHVMIGPSPCYINDGDYVGGFTRADMVTPASR